MSATIVGYVRGSETETNVRRLRAAGAVQVFVEPDLEAGGTRQRDAALAACTRGDQLIVAALDHLAPSARELIETLRKLEAAGVDFRSLAEGLDTSTTDGRLFHIVSALTALEGLRPPGRRSILDAEREAKIVELRADGFTLEQVAKAVKVSEKTVRRYLKRKGLK